MAFEIPQKWPLVQIQANRSTSGDKDCRLVNCYAELIPSTGEYQIEKRPGLAISPYGSSGGVGRGMYFWSTITTTGVLLYVVGSNVYYNGTLLGTVAAPSGATVFSPMYHFVQIRTTGLQVLAGDAISAYVITPTAITPITDVNFPTGRVPGWAYLNGIIYCMTSDGGIHGTQNLNDPTVWDPLNLIIAQVEPDGGVYLTKNLVYVVAMKEWTTEIFWDAGNPTGSALLPVQGGFLNYGCMNPDTVQELDGTLLWMATNKDSSPQFVRMDNLQLTVISTPAVERRFEGSIPGDDYASFVVRRGGHRFYVVTNKTKNVTQAFDLDQQIPLEWTDVNGNYWPYVAKSFDAAGLVLVQHETNGTICAIEPDYKYNTDIADIIPVDIYTPNTDFDIDRVKVLSMMRIVGDKVPSSILKVRCSDDDYQTWSNFRQIDLNQKRPILTDLGSFYRRAYNFRHESATPFRITAAALQMALGTA